jgi:hypothetical protein
MGKRWRFSQLKIEDFAWRVYYEITVCSSRVVGVSIGTGANQIDQHKISKEDAVSKEPHILIER